MVEPIRITDSLMNDRADQVDKIVEKVNRHIAEAVSKGLRRCYFPCDDDSPFYKDVRKRFEQYGYRIRPTGYIGFEWQLTEDIEW